MKFTVALLICVYMLACLVLSINSYIIGRGGGGGGGGGWDGNGYLIWYLHRVFYFNFYLTFRFLFSKVVAEAQAEVVVAAVTGMTIEVGCHFCFTKMVATKSFSKLFYFSILFAQKRERKVVIRKVSYQQSSII
jgi:hypothetical protein